MNNLKYNFKYLFKGRKRQYNKEFNTEQQFKDYMNKLNRMNVFSLNVKECVIEAKAESKPVLTHVKDFYYRDKEGYKYYINDGVKIKSKTKIY